MYLLHRRFFEYTKFDLYLFPQIKNITNNVTLILGGKTPDVGSRTYTEIMKEQYLRAEETEVRPDP